MSVIFWSKYIEYILFFPFQKTAQLVDKDFISTQKYTMSVKLLS